MRSHRRGKPSGAAVFSKNDSAGLFFEGGKQKEVWRANSQSKKEEMQKKEKVARYINFKKYLCRMEKSRAIIHFGDYFPNFYASLELGARRKVAYILDMLKTEVRLSEKFVKFIRDGLFELRAEHSGNIYRVFFIFDKGNIVVLFNGFQKKSQKTPSEEIKKALKIKEEYFLWKQNNK